MMSEIMRQTPNSRQLATAPLGGRFAYFAIERSCLFDDQYPCFGAFAFQHESGCRAGKRAPDDYDVVIEIHRSKRMAFIPLLSKRASDADNPVCELLPRPQRLFRLSLHHGAGRIACVTR